MRFPQAKHLLLSVMLGGRFGGMLAVVLAVAVMGHVPSASADVIISNAGPPPSSGFVFGAPLGVVATSWILPQSFDHVSITADVGAGGNGFTGTAFLTTKVGAGTTVADQVAQAAFTFPNQFIDPPTVTLFSNLSLTSGLHYFLVLSASTSGGWHVSPIQDVTRDRFLGVQSAGSTFSAPFFDLFAGGGPGYPPASNFVPFTSSSLFGLELLYTVNGQPVEPGGGPPGSGTVPGPATLALVVVGLPGLAWAARRSLPRVRRSGRSGA
jgi:hypothetical protein